MNKWYVQVTEIKHQNRWAKCIIDSNNSIVLEIEFMDIKIANSIVNTHNDSVELSYEIGMKEGVKITKEVYGDK